MAKQYSDDAHAMARMILDEEELNAATAKEILGECIHTAMRKTNSGAHTRRAYDMIDHMPADEWDGILAWIINALNVMDIHIVKRNS